jgi:hypothetical protein
VSELFCKGREDVTEHATIRSKEEGMTRLKAYFLRTKSLRRSMREAPQ